VPGWFLAFSQGNSTPGDSMAGPRRTARSRRAARAPGGIASQAEDRQPVPPGTCGRRAQPCGMSSRFGDEREKYINDYFLGA